QTFTASDGYFNLAVGNEGQWGRLCDLLDDVVATEAERWYRVPAYARNADRVAARDELTERLNAIFRTRPRADWLRRFAAAGIPAGSVNSVAEALEHPQVQARGMVQETEHPTIGPMRAVRTPLTFVGSELASPTAPPLPGADTAAILR